MYCSITAMRWWPSPEYRLICGSFKWVLECMMYPFIFFYLFFWTGNVLAKYLSIIYGAGNLEIWKRDVSVSQKSINFNRNSSSISFSENWCMRIHLLNLQHSVELTSLPRWRRLLSRTLVMAATKGYSTTWPALVHWSRLQFYCWLGWPVLHPGFSL